MKPGSSSSEGGGAPALPVDELLERIAAAHSDAFRAVTGKWRERQTLVRTAQGGTFFPSDVGALAAVLPRIGLAGRILEVGSGDGRLLSLLALLRQTRSPGITAVTGVELEADYLEASRRARRRLSPPLDFTATTEVCGDVLALDLGAFDAILYFSGGAMPERAEEAFRAALDRQLRADAILIAWGPDAEEFTLPLRERIAVPGYHTVHVYRGVPTPGGQSSSTRTEKS